MPPTASGEERVFRSVRRCCYAGLDSVRLRTEMIRRIAPLLSFDAHHFAITDPDTGLFTHAVADGLPASLNTVWLEHLYPFRVAGEIIGMAQNGTAVQTETSSAVMDILRPEGLGHDMRSVFAERGDAWGFVCLLRGRSSPGFTEREAAFMRRLAPHLTQGLRAAALLDRASGAGWANASGAGWANDHGTGGANANGAGSGSHPLNGRGAEPGDLSTPPAPPDEPVGTGVLVMDRRGRIQTRNGAAERYLHDLEDVGRGSDAVPYAVSSALVQLHHRYAEGEADASLPLTGQLRSQGRSGRWYTIRASLAEPDATGTSATIVLIDPSAPADIAPILTRLYGLTPREREIVSLAAKGRSTKWIARQLSISPYTVQEHLGNACDKVGVRTRKVLLAKLFVDGYAPGLTG